MMRLNNNETMRSLSSKKPSKKLSAIADLIGSVKGLPADLSARKKRYLKAGYGKKRPR